MPAKLPTQPFPRRINIAELEQRLACSRRTIERWYLAGRFPRPHHLGQNRVWWLAEVEAWEEERALAPPPRAPPRPPRSGREKLRAAHG